MEDLRTTVYTEQPKLRYIDYGGSELQFRQQPKLRYIDYGGSELQFRQSSQS